MVLISLCNMRNILKTMQDSLPIIIKQKGDGTGKVNQWHLSDY